MENFWVGTFPDWLVGVGTIALALLTVVGLRRERAEKRHLQAELREQADKETRLRLDEAVQVLEQEHRAQAERVVVWAEVLEGSEINLSDDGVFRGNYYEVAIVQNDSSLPISSVWVHWCDSGGPAPLETREIRTVPPRSRRSFATPRSLNQQPSLPIEIDFTDAQGVKWKRGRDGGLRELSESETSLNG